MIVHPLLLAVSALDLVSLLFVLLAALTSARVVAGWSPGSADQKQIALETRAEAASIQARWGLLFLLVSTATLIVGITTVLPGVVAGAMCGTGVLEATEGAGRRALAMRGAAVALLFAWHLLDRLNRSGPGSHLAVGSAKALLLATPLLVIAVVDTVGVVTALDLHRPVDCCSVVYDRIRPAVEGRIGLVVPDHLRVLGWAAGSVLLLLLGLRIRLSPTAALGKEAPTIALLSLAWIPVSATVLVRVLAVDEYGVLHHHCPWCLFLPHHTSVGVPLFGSLVAVALEGPAAYLCSVVAARVPELSREALRRSRTAALRTVVAVVLFLAVAGLPPLVWRLRFGVWIG